MKKIGRHFHNKRPDLFRLNDRVVQIRINFNGKPVKTVNLSDTMGWHKITLPRRAFRWLTIELTGIRIGDGKDNDICLSELALYSRGQKVDFQMPRAVIYQLSSCCGGTGWLINRAGRVLTKSPTGEGGRIAWSPDGNRVAGLKFGGKAQKLWVAAVNEPRIVRRLQFKFKDFRYGFDLNWKSNRHLKLSRRQEINKKIISRVVKRIAVS